MNPADGSHEIGLIPPISLDCSGWGIPMGHLCVWALLTYVMSLLYPHRVCPMYPSMGCPYPGLQFCSGQHCPCHGLDVPVIMGILNLKVVGIMNPPLSYPCPCTHGYRVEEEDKECTHSHGYTVLISFYSVLAVCRRSTGKSPPPLPYHYGSERGARAGSAPPLP